MPERYKVKIKVISQEGNCAADHKVGDEFIIHKHTPANFCIFAYSALDCEVRSLMFGGVYPWSDDGKSYIGCCPDPANPVVFRLERVEIEGKS